jgi:hypothetical protein
MCVFCYQERITRRREALIALFVFTKIVLYLSEFCCSKLMMLLYCQGEEYKLFWPDQQEFERMAARFGATIVPFGVVGEDDIAEVSMCFCSY